MNLTIKPEYGAAWAAIVAKANAGRAEGEPEMTLEAYAQARLDELGASYQTTLIAEAKAAYDEVITLAATLTEDKKAELVAFVQALAEESGEVGR